MCEEFGYGPPEAIEALENDAAGLHIAIMGLRSYAAAKRRYDAATTAKDIPTGPEIDQVIEIEMAVAQEDIDAEQRDGIGP